jgi:hypothetical protein
MFPPVQHPYESATEWNERLAATLKAQRRERVELMVRAILAGGFDGDSVADLASLIVVAEALVDAIDARHPL